MCFDEYSKLYLEHPRFKLKYDSWRKSAKYILIKKTCAKYAQVRTKTKQPFNTFDVKSAVTLKIEEFYFPLRNRTQDNLIKENSFAEIF